MTEPARGAEISRLRPPAQMLLLKDWAGSVSWFSTLSLGLPVRWMLLGLKSFLFPQSPSRQGQYSQWVPADLRADPPLAGGHQCLVGRARCSTVRHCPRKQTREPR